MPHAVLSYSADLHFDAAAVLQDIEATILAHDAGAGACKGRAYPSEIFHHTHLMVDISLLDKPHRNSAFLRNLSQDLERRIKSRISLPCAFSIELRFSAPAYVTNMHHGQD